MKDAHILKAKCLGKVAHKTMTSAQYAIDNMHKDAGHILEIYKCQFCGNYHIGHKMGTKKKKG